MRTVIITGCETELAIPVLACAWLSGKCLLHRVTGFLNSIDYPSRTASCRLTFAVGTWLFSLFCLLTVLSPAGTADKISSLLLLAFLLQAGAIDAASGYLPLTFTGRLTLAGLLAVFLVTPSGPPALNRLLETGVMGGLMGLMHWLVNRRHERIGRGDFWLITGLTAWAGIQNAALVTLAGVAAFLLWHISSNASDKKEGPLGPWLCVSGGIYLLDKLYNPVWINSL